MPNSWFFCEYDRRDIQKHHLNYLGIRENDFSDNLWSIANNRRINCRIWEINTLLKKRQWQQQKNWLSQYAWSTAGHLNTLQGDENASLFIGTVAFSLPPSARIQKKKHVRSSKWSTQQIKVRAITLSHPYSLFQNGNSCFLWSKLHCNFIWSIWLQLINPEGKVFYYFQRRMGK